MQMKKLAILLAAAGLATALLTGCPWDEEDKTDDAASSTPGSSSSSSQPGGDEDDGPATYTVKASVNGAGGSVSVNPESVQQGGDVTVTINPDSGYAIDSVTDNGNDVTTSVNNSPYTIQNVTEDHTIIVTFKLTVDLTDPTTWKTTGTAPNKTIIAPDGIKLTAELAKEMLDVEGVNSIDLSKSGITSIPDKTFQNSNLVSITVPDDTAIGNYAFDGCTSLKTVSGTLGDVGQNAFGRCSSLTSIKVDGNVDGQAFQFCSQMSSAWIAGSVGMDPFLACFSLRNLWVSKDFSFYGENAFNEVSGLTVHYNGPEDKDFERQFRISNISRCQFDWGCNGSDWTTITGQPAASSSFAQFLLGL